MTHPALLPKERLLELAALAEKATPGPWEYLEAENWIFAGKADGGARIFEIQSRSKDVGVEIRTANARYVAACSPDTIKALLAHIAASGWQPISSAPRDGTEVEYWHEKWQMTSACKWCEPEGLDPHWWDDSMTETAEPVWWRPKIIPVQS